MKPYQVEYNRGILLPFDDLPDNLHKVIVDLTTKVMLVALWEYTTKERIDPNIGLAAVQRALSLMILNLFPDDKKEEIGAAMCEALLRTLKEVKPYQGEI